MLLRTMALSPALLEINVVGQEGKFWRRPIRRGSARPEHRPHFAEWQALPYRRLVDLTMRSRITRWWCRWGLKDKPPALHDPGGDLERVPAVRGCCRKERLAEVAALALLPCLLVTRCDQLPCCVR